MLQTGDVIELKDGMEVYTNIPEMFVYSNRQLSGEMARSDIRIGKIYRGGTLSQNEVDELSKEILNVFSSRGFPLKLRIARAFADSVLPKTEERIFCIKPGRFLVVRTTEDGGSNGGGGMSGRDYYPDGHHVFCEKLIGETITDRSIAVDFYETGCFTAMITGLKPVEKLARTIKWSKK